MLEKIKSQSEWIKYAININSAADISAGMLKGAAKYNLNAQAHDTTIKLIRLALEQHLINISEIYIDTVGPPDAYRIKLEAIFPKVRKIVVAKKADSIYPVVSAASICAKVTRDDIMENWSFIEQGFNDESACQNVAHAKEGDDELYDKEDIDQEVSLKRKSKSRFGSGYPSGDYCASNRKDPNTVQWLKENCDPVFAYPRLIRFSWQTCTKLIKENCVDVTWHDDDEDDRKHGLDIRKFYQRKRMRDDVPAEEERKPKKSIEGREREQWLKDIIGLEPVTLKK